ncbi:MAG: hypothetical protein ACK4HW_07365 [Roseinatronobacter sp.]
MIRTPLVELSTIPAIAFRRKLKGGKSGVVIQRFGVAQPGLALINRADGSPDIAHNTPLEHFPVEAFVEALARTQGLPFNQRGAIKLSDAPETSDDEEAADVVTVCSKEYAAVTAAYTDKTGALSYDLLNRDFVKFAKSSKVVSRMIGEGADFDTIKAQVLRSRFEKLTGNRDLSDAQITAIVDMLDEVSPRHVFKMLNDELRKMLAR